MSNGLLPRHPLARLSAIVSILLLTVAPVGLAWLHMDNGIDQWVAGDGAAGMGARFEEDFGRNDFLLLAYEGAPLFDEDALDLQIEVLGAVEAIPAVRSVQSLPSLFRDHFGAESGAELEAEVETSPFYDKLIISENRRMGGMIIGSRDTFSASGRRAYIASLQNAATPFRAAGWKVHLVGPDVVNATLDETSEREARRLLPVAVLLSCVLLCFLLRSLKKMALVALVSATTLVISLGIMGWLGLTMNMVTVALPPVLWVLSSAYTVHLLRYYDRALEEGWAPQDGVTRAFETALRPTLLAGLTTALGFLALATATMAPARELGLAAALGIPVALCVSGGLAPLLLPFLHPGKITGPNLASPIPLKPVDKGMPRFTVPVLVFAGLLACLCAFSTSRVVLESNPLTFLDSDAPLVRDSAVVAEAFTGLYTLETVLQLPGSWLDPAAWPDIESQSQVLSAAPGVARVLSPLDYLKKQNQWAEGGDGAAYRLPDDRETAETLLREVPEDDLALLRALVSPDGTRVRLSSLVRVMDGEKLLKVVEASEAVLEKSGLPGYHGGVVLRLVQAQFALIETQLMSLGIAIVLIFGSVAIGLRSVRLLVLSIAPNLAPVLAIFGIMGLAGIPLDPATVMVAAMTLGIAVDDSMHLLITWQEQCATTGDSRASLRQAVQINGPAMTTTTLTACAGFLTLGLSEFAPIRYFGLLSAATMAVALAADLWLLPALIQVSTPREVATP